MNAIMYHYVRERDPEYPQFRFLHIDDFVSQLDYFAKSHRFISSDGFIDMINGEAEFPDDVVLLTFDDGFLDHYKYVLPELIKRGTFGLFYIPTAPLEHGQLLDVHKIHLLTGRVNGPVLLSQLQALISAEMVKDENISEFREGTYLTQDNSAAILLVKRTLNYFISYGYRREVIDKLTEMNGISIKINEFYLDCSQIKEMHRLGMMIGSHSVNHPVFSKISESDQLREIQRSFSFLDEIVGGFRMKTFCYPYGGFHAFSHNTETMLADEGCRFSFNVESRDFFRRDFLSRRQALLRYDCNQFPYGAAR